MRRTRSTALLCGLLAGLAVFAVAHVARGADLPRKAAPYAPYVAAPTPVLWAGLYVGVNGGYGWSGDSLGLTPLDAGGRAAASAALVPGTLDTSSSGGMFGGTVGYQWQFGDRFVAGAEVDVDWSGIRGSDSFQRVVGPASVTVTGESKLRWIGTARGRFGYLVTPRTLVYGTGGLAFGGVSSDATGSLTTPIPVLNASVVSSVSDTRTGWTVGAGVEQKITDRWSAKAEYRHVDLGSADGTLGAVVLGTPVTFSTSQRFKYDMVLVGVNYAFGGL